MTTKSADNSLARMSRKWRALGFIVQIIGLFTELISINVLITTAYQTGWFFFWGGIVMVIVGGAIVIGDDIRYEYENSARP